MLHLHIFKHVVDALFDLCFCEVIWEPQSGSIVECTLNREVAVNDILLRNIAQLRTEGSKIPIIILPIIENGALLSRTLTIKRIHERRFTRTRTSHQRDKGT